MSGVSYSLKSIIFSRQFSIHSNRVFFSSKKCALYLKKNAILCLCHKNVSPSKRVLCFILNNLNFLMVEGIAFYALYKSRVLIILCKADYFCLFIGLHILFFCWYNATKYYFSVLIFKIWLIRPYFCITAFICYSFA